MSYQIRISPAAERSIARLWRELQLAVRDKLAARADNPRPPGSRRIRGLPQACEVYRVRVGKTHRVIYQFADQWAVILVVKVADRKDVYKRMADLRQSTG